MCTLTVFPLKSSTNELTDLYAKKSEPRWLITMNRDESVTREEGEPKTQTFAGNRLHYWHPVDKKSGGTWFGVHGAGFALALLNRYQDAENFSSNASDELISRGKIIPDLFKGCDLTPSAQDELLNRCESIPFSDFAPFDLYVFAHNYFWQIAWDGRQKRVRELPLSPLFAFSSSVDVIEAESIRRKAYHSYLDEIQLLGGLSSWNQVISLLHAKQHTVNTSYGFNMSRPGRHTKSISQAIIGVQKSEPECYRCLTRQQFMSLDI